MKFYVKSVIGHCVKYAITYRNKYRGFSPYTEKYGQRKPVFWYILLSGFSVYGEEGRDSKRKIGLSRGRSY